MAFNLETTIVRFIIPNGDTIGTGFVLTDDGLIATCAHVVADAGAGPGETVNFVFHSTGEERQAVVEVNWWRKPEAEDVAILKLIGKLPEPVKPLPLGVSTGAANHPFETMGFPPTNPIGGVLGSGVILGQTKINEIPVLQLRSQEVTGGFSGAPVWDCATRRVVGMVNATANPDGRWRLAETAFITPAEVLQKLCSTLTLRPPEPVEAYLAALRDYCVNLPYLTLHDIRPSKTLDEVYVPLKARMRDEDRKVRRDDKREPEEKLAERESRQMEPIGIREVLQQSQQPHIMILGEPGSGKSTLLRQLAECAWDTPDSIGLDAPYLPLLIPLRRLALSEGAWEDRLHRTLEDELSLAQALPAGFFTDWFVQAGARWLILLDAFDEVPDDERVRLLQWLKGLFKNLNLHRVILTSRDSGYTCGDLGDQLFAHYDLLPFTPEQTGDFARNWFGKQSGNFLDALQRIHVGDLRGTPLLLTIAAKVYLDKGVLPERRSTLYDQFVDIWLQEAEQRGLKADLAARPSKVTKYALARLALAMTEDPSLQTEADLAPVAATYLTKALKLTPDEAEADSYHFVQIMARRSGIFTRRGDTCAFIHPTFREYLAALAEVRESNYDSEQVWQKAVCRWREENWREVALFALSLLSDRQQDVSSLVKRIWQEGIRDDLLFAGMVLVERIKVSTEVGEQIIEALFEDTRTHGYFDDKSVVILGQLANWPIAVQGLLELAYDIQLGIRYEAIRALGQLGRTEDLLALARDEQVYIWARREAADVLSQLDHIDEAAQAWVVLASDTQVDDTGVADAVRQEAVQSLGQLNQSDDLLAVARDTQVADWIREAAARVLGQLGHIDEAVQARLALACDKQVGDWCRYTAIQALGQLGRTADMLALARGEQGDEWIRLLTVQTLGQFDQANDLLLMLTRDEQVNVVVRQKAASTLGQLGYVGNLLALACDKQAQKSGRLLAILGLSEWGADADVLLELAKIAKQDKDKKVRQAAWQAIVQIKQRIKRTGRN